MPAATFPLKQLTAGISAVNAVIPSNPSNELLKSILIDVGPESAQLIASDGEISISRDLQRSEPGDPFRMLLSARQLSAWLRELRGETVSFSVTKTAVEIEAGFSLFTLNGSDPASYPSFLIDVPSETLVVPVHVLHRAINRTEFVCDVASARYALGAVQFEYGDQTLTLAATDSRRLAVVQEPCASEGVPAGMLALCPQRAMKAVAANLPDSPAPVKIAATANSVIFATDSMALTAQQTSGRFPDWRKVIPKQFGLSIDLVAGPFHSAVRQALIITTEESRGVEFTLAPGMLRLESQAADIGQSKIEVPISYDGPPLAITFDPRYVADFLKTLDAARNVTLQLTDGESAALLSAGDEYRYVVMPLSKD